MSYDVIRLHKLSQGKQAGFTLLELMITTFLGALLLLGASSMFLVFISGNATTNVRRQINQEGQQIISTMEFRLRNAKEVTNCTGANTIIAYKDIENVAHELKLAGGVFIADDSALHSIFVASSDVAPFTCSQDSSTGKQKVTISFTLTKAGTSLSQDFSTNVEVRNTGLR